jgi:hypothetical protein
MICSLHMCPERFPGMSDLFQWKLCYFYNISVCEIEHNEFATSMDELYSLIFEIGWNPDR